MNQALLRQLICEKNQAAGELANYLFSASYRLAAQAQAGYSEGELKSVMNHTLNSIIY